MDDSRAKKSSPRKTPRLQRLRRKRPLKPHRRKSEKSIPQDHGWPDCRSTRSSPQAATPTILSMTSQKHDLSPRQTESHRPAGTRYAREKPDRTWPQDMRQKSGRFLRPASPPSAIPATIASSANKGATSPSVRAGPGSRITTPNPEPAREPGSSNAIGPDAAKGSYAERQTCVLQATPSSCPMPIPLLIQRHGTSRPCAGRAEARDQFAAPNSVTATTMPRRNQPPPPIASIWTRSRTRA